MWCLAVVELMLCLFKSPIASDRLVDATTAKSTARRVCEELAEFAIFPFGLPAWPNAMRKHGELDEVFRGKSNNPSCHRDVHEVGLPDLSQIRSARRAGQEETST